MSEKNFQKVKKIGQGSFGTVYKVKRRADGQHYAMKKIKLLEMKEKQKKNSLNQVRLLASIEHPHIISYKEAFFDQETNYLCLVMELASKGDLTGLIEEKRKKKKTFYEYEIWQIGGDILKGIETLHKNKIIHRDLKPANIFFNSQNQAKIGDMNVSKLLEGNMAFTQTGTPYYASPQVWNNQPYSYECDIWSFGCILYEMCCFRNPFKQKSLDKLYEKIKKLKFEPIPFRFSEVLSQTINKCLKYRHQRISMSQLRKVFDEYMPPKGQDKVFPPNKILLNTIKMPSNKKQLKSILPKQKYNDSDDQINPESHILDNFLIKSKESKREEKRKNLSMVNSQKYLKEIPVKKVLPQTPSFKNILSPYQEIPLYERYSLNRLNLRRRKLRIALNF